MKIAEKEKPETLVKEEVEKATKKEKKKKEPKEQKKKVQMPEISIDVNTSNIKKYVIIIISILVVAALVFYG